MNARSTCRNAKDRTGCRRGGSPFASCLMLPLTAALLILTAAPLASHAQTSLDVRGPNGGSVIVGYDANTCDASIEGALRFNSADGGSSCAAGDFEESESDYMSWTPSTNQTSTDTATISFWHKRESAGGSVQYPVLYRAGVDDSWIGSEGDYLTVALKDPSQTQIGFSTNNTITDTSSWHHFLIHIDLGQAVVDDKVTIWVDGTEDTQTLISNAITSYEDSFLANGAITTIGKSGSDSLDGLLAELYVIDGSLEPLSSFYDAGEAVSYSGSYGNNGFYIDFSDSGDLGADSPGNGNDFTNNGAVQATGSYPTCDAVSPGIEYCDASDWTPWGE